MPGQFMEEGEHKVLYQASDEDGNNAKCEFTVTVMNHHQKEIKRRK